MACLRNFGRYSLRADGGKADYGEGVMSLSYSLLLISWAILAVMVHWEEWHRMPLDMYW
jgi:hypothetical protein